MDAQTRAVRQIDRRRTDGQIVTQADRHIERRAGRETAGEVGIHRQAGRLVDKQPGRETDCQTCRQMDRQINKEPGGHTNRLVVRHRQADV